MVDPEAEALLPADSGADCECSGVRSAGPGVSFGGGLLNTLKSSVGAGILSFPYGFSIAGWAGGMCTSILVTLVALYGLRKICQVRLLVLEDRVRRERTTGFASDPEVSEQDIKAAAAQRRDYLEFTDLAELTVGVWLKRAVIGLVLLAQLGCCTAYMIFMSNNLHSLLASVPLLSSLPRESIVLFLLPLCMALSFVRSLRSLLPAAILGLVLMVAGLATVAVFGAAKINDGVRQLELPDAFGNGMGLMVFIGISLFATESVNQIPALQASMQRPAQFPTLLNIAMGVVCSLYLIVGLGGAALFGKETDSVITRNMGNSGLGQAARVLFVVYILATFPFQMFPAGAIVDRIIDPDAQAQSSGTGENGSACWRFFTNFFTVRILLCTVAFVPALFLTDFGSFLSLIGYPCMGNLGICVPALMCLSVDARSKRSRMSGLDRAVCWVYLAGGIVFIIAGTIFSVAEVIHSNQEQSVPGQTNPTEIATL